MNSVVLFLCMKFQLETLCCFFCFFCFVYVLFLFFIFYFFFVFFFFFFFFCQIFAYNCNCIEDLEYVRTGCSSISRFVETFVAVLETEKSLTEKAEQGRKNCGMYTFSWG